MSTGSAAIRYRIFAYTTFWFLLLFGIGALNIARPDLLSPLLTQAWQRAALHSIWFAILGGVSISYKGLYDHWQANNWTEGKWTLWYLGRPFSSAIVGAVTYVILQVTNPNQPPSIAALAVAAFILGTQERRFFNLLYEVAKLVLAVPNDPGPESASTSTSSLTSKVVTPPAGGTVPKVGGANATSEVSFADNGGRILEAVEVQLIFWGTVWKQALSPSAAEVGGAVATVLASPYTSGLRQYRGIRPGTLLGSVTVSQSDPPNPFRTDDVANFVHDQIKNRVVPEPDLSPDLLYCVILPPGVNCVDSSIIGEHSYSLYVDYDPPIDLDVNWTHFAWVTNDGTLPSITTIFSHELVESCTDPEGTGWTAQSGPCSGSGWCEIGDVCSSTAQVGGVTVQSYWSQGDKACVVPGSQS
jgi:hypothetical protein